MVFSFKKINTEFIVTQNVNVRFWKRCDLLTHATFNSTIKYIGLNWFQCNFQSWYKFRLKFKPPIWNSKKKAIGKWQVRAVLGHKFKIDHITFLSFQCNLRKTSTCVCTKPSKLQNVSRRRRTNEKFCQCYFPFL